MRSILNFTFTYRKKRKIIENRNKLYCKNVTINENDRNYKYNRFNNTYIVW